MHDKEHEYMISNVSAMYTFALHYLLQYQPPAHLLLGMLACYQQVFPTSIKKILCTIDSKGHTPILLQLSQLKQCFAMKTEVKMSCFVWGKRLSNL